jgi:type I site-specific restriction endonuclease
MPDPTYESEWLTRKKRIDTRLKALGWEIVPFAASTPLSDYAKHAIEEFPTDSGPADYALCVNGRILGIVEAKRLSLGPQNVLVQAQRYSRGVAANPLSFGEFRVPFLYSTNGEVIWFHDVRHALNLSRKIADLPTPASLEEMLAHQFRREDLEEGEKFDPKVMPSAYLLEPQPSHSFLYICTIQRMAINLFGRQAMFEQGDDEAEDDADKLDIPIHAFDVIVADECHRAYISAELSVWRNTNDTSHVIGSD